MHSFDEVINNRHSTRVFLEKEISAEDEKYIDDAINNAPTAGNMTLFNVIKIKDKKRLERLSILCDNQPFIKTGTMALVFVTNPIRWYDAYNEINDTSLNPTLADYYLGMADGLIAAQTAVLAAENKDIGSCYIGDIVENYEEIKTILKLPRYVNVITLLVFGYKDINKKGIRPPKFKKNDIINNEYFESKGLEDFVNLNAGDKEKAINQVNRVFNFKMKSEFFKEMNRSLKHMINEYNEEEKNER